MRRNHMNILKHQRDETMRKGLRGSQDSLKNCIECHVNPKTNSVASSKDDFCMGCHNYAAVKIDCFECHSSKPKAPAGGMHPVVTPEKPEGKDNQSGLSGKLHWQMQAKQASLNMGEGVK
jgi:5-methylcytosine-specific restriction endonuclease McrA